MIIKASSRSKISCWSRSLPKSESWSSGTTLLRSSVHPWFMSYSSSWSKSTGWSRSWYYSYFWSYSKKNNHSASWRTNI